MTLPAGLTNSAEPSVSDSKSLFVVQRDSSLWFSVCEQGSGEIRAKPRVDKGKKRQGEKKNVEFSERRLHHCTHPCREEGAMIRFNGFHSVCDFLEESRTKKLVYSFNKCIHYGQNSKLIPVNNT